MIKVAVTGGAGAGKTLVSECFRRLGAFVINLDDLAREAVLPGSSVLAAIVDHFGREILLSDGTLDRSRLRRLITRDAKERAALEQLVHPEIWRLFDEKVSAIASRHRDAVVVAEVPLLIELGAQGEFDVVVLVEADADLQAARLTARDGGSEADARALLGIQMSTEEKRPFADYIVYNSGSVGETASAVRHIYEKIRKRVDTCAEL